VSSFNTDLTCLANTIITKFNKENQLILSKTKLKNKKLPSLKLLKDRVGNAKGRFYFIIKYSLESLLIELPSLAIPDCCCSAAVAGESERYFSVYSPSRIISYPQSRSHCPTNRNSENFVFPFSCKKVKSVCSKQAACEAPNTPRICIS